MADRQLDAVYGTVGDKLNTLKGAFVDNMVTYTANDGDADKCTCFMESILCRYRICQSYKRRLSWIIQKVKSLSRGGGKDGRTCGRIGLADKTTI